MARGPARALHHRHANRSTYNRVAAHVNVLAGPTHRPAPTSGLLNVPDTETPLLVVAPTSPLAATLPVTVVVTVPNAHDPDTSPVSVTNSDAHTVPSLAVNRHWPAKRACTLPCGAAPARWIPMISNVPLEALVTAPVLAEVV
jgi:hypothetical protein